MGLFDNLRARPRRFPRNLPRRTQLWRRQGLSPIGIVFEPLKGVFHGGSVAGHVEACLTHEVDVVRVPVESPGEFFDGEHLGVVVFEHDQV